MPRIGPIGRKDFLSCLRRMGFEGPYAGGKHQIMQVPRCANRWRADTSVRSPAVSIETGVPPQLRNGLPLAAAAGGRSPQADIHPGHVAIEVRAVSKHQALQQKGRSDQPQLNRYGSAPKRRSGTSQHGVRFGTAPTGAHVRGARRSQDCHGQAIERAAGWHRSLWFHRPQRTLQGSVRSHGKGCG
jgi:hypothetical protein